MKDNEENVYVGEHVAYIDLAFNDYVEKNGDYYEEVIKNKKYYLFTVIASKDTLIIRIQFNQKILKEKTGLMFKGGGGEYEFDKKTEAIISKKLWK